MSVYAVDRLMAQTRKLAADYRKATGQPLPLTAEIANFDAARLLDLKLIQPSPGGYDAIGQSGEREGMLYQIKGRAIFDEGKSGQRIGQLKLEQAWDAVLLVLLDEEYQPFAIYEADRATLETALAETPPNKRGAMSVARFRIISSPVWSREEGVIVNEIWDNQGDNRG